MSVTVNKHSKLLFDCTFVNKNISSQLFVQPLNYDMK